MVDGAERTRSSRARPLGQELLHVFDDRAPLVDDHIAEVQGVHPAVEDVRGPPVDMSTKPGKPVNLGLPGGVEQPNQGK